jgi:RNA polymerase sigma-70 factor (ECF subfamily)
VEVNKEVDAAVPPNPPRVPSDEDLALRAQRGCASSFEHLVRRFQAPVLQFLRRRGAGADSEDLLQETLVRAYSNLHRYRPRWRFATWLFTIARRIAINHYRRTRASAGGEFLESIESRAAGPFQEIVEAEKRQRQRGLWDIAAAALSEEQMSAVWLFYVEEMSAREIAAVLDRSWVSVKTMLFRARRRLIPLLEDLNPGGSSQSPGASGVKRRPNGSPDLEVPHV